MLIGTKEKSTDIYIQEHSMNVSVIQDAIYSKMI